MPSNALLGGWDGYETLPKPRTAAGVRGVPAAGGVAVSAGVVQRVIGGWRDTAFVITKSGRIRISSDKGARKFR